MHTCKELKELNGRYTMDRNPSLSPVDAQSLSVLSWSKSRPLIPSRYECLPVAKINRVSRISLEATLPITALECPYALFLSQSNSKFSEDNQ